MKDCTMQFLCLLTKWADKKRVKFVFPSVLTFQQSLSALMYPTCPCLFSLPENMELQPAVSLISHLTLTSRLNRNPHNQVSWPFNHFKEISTQSQKAHRLPTQLSPSLCTSESSQQLECKGNYWCQSAQTMYKLRMDSKYTNNFFKTEAQMELSPLPKHTAWSQPSPWSNHQGWGLHWSEVLCWR